MGTVFKNRDQMEEEDSIRHRKKMETIFKNKEAKRIAQWQEGFKCTFIEDCGQIFPTPQELQAHTRLMFMSFQYNLILLIWNIYSFYGGIKKSAKRE